MEEGYITISRKLFTHQFWKEKRSFSEWEAWIDLIQSARFEPTVCYKCVRGREIALGRGQLIASIRFLVSRWNWGRHKVTHYLYRLKRDKMIEISNKQGINIITLCRYNQYNKLQEKEPQGTLQGTVNDLTVSELEHIVGQQLKLAIQKGDSEGTKKNKEKKEYNTKETTTNVVVQKRVAAGAATLSQRKKKFYDELVSYQHQYSNQLLRAFFDYWSEMNRSKTQMKFEQQSTWETARRLSTWARNEERYGQKNKRNEKYQRTYTETYGNEADSCNFLMQPDTDTTEIKRMLNGIGCD